MDPLWFLLKSRLVEGKKDNDNNYNNYLPCSNSVFRSVGVDTQEGRNN